jgi:hypothetical protein
MVRSAAPPQNVYVMPPPAPPPPPIVYVLPYLSASRTRVRHMIKTFLAIPGWGIVRESPCYLTMDSFMPNANINLATATDEDLARLKAMTDDDLLRSALSLDLFAGVEASRRLREAMQKEEGPTKRLTGVLVALTILLVVIGIGPALNEGLEFGCQP